MLTYTEQGLTEAIITQYRLFDGRTLYAGNHVAMAQSANIVLWKLHKLFPADRVMLFDADTVDGRRVQLRIRRRENIYQMEELK